MRKAKKKALKKAKKRFYKITGPWQGHETEHNLFRVLEQLIKAI